jgi:molecular chaperone DnaJ
MEDMPIRGRDLKYKKDVSFITLIRGGELKFKISYEDVCTICNGTGAKETKECGSCSGSGGISESSFQGGVSFSTFRTCNVCSGRGREVMSKCDDCHGTGRIFISDREIVVEIPPGTRDGQVRAYRGFGGEGTKGAPKGDLLVKLSMIMPNINLLTEEQIKILESISD